MAKIDKPAPKSARGRLKEIRVEWAMYNFMVHCVIGPHEDLGRYVKYRHESTYDAPAHIDCVGLYFHDLPGRGGILWLSREPRTPAQIGHLSHEMGHAVMNLFRYVNMRTNTKTEEPFCYAIAHGVEQVLKGVRK